MMENRPGPFVDGFPAKNGGFSIATQYLPAWFQLF
jgi:hypothetical protein